jgi:hypothetical protein
MVKGGFETSRFRAFKLGSTKFNVHRPTAQTASTRAMWRCRATSAKATSRLKSAMRERSRIVLTATPSPLSHRPRYTAPNPPWPSTDLHPSVSRSSCAKGTLSTAPFPPRPGVFFSAAPEGGAVTLMQSNICFCASFPFS